MFSVIFLFFFLKRAFALGHFFEDLESEVPQGSPSNLLVSCQVESDRVDVLENFFYSAIDVAFLRLGFCPQHVRDFDFLTCLLVVLEEEVPAEGRLHVVYESSLLVSFLVQLFLLLCAIWLLLTAVVQILVNDLLDIIEFLSLESLKQDVVLNVLKHMWVDATQLLSATQPLFFLLIIEVLFPDPHSL